MLIGAQVTDVASDSCRRRQLVLDCWPHSHIRCARHNHKQDQQLDDADSVSCCRCIWKLEGDDLRPCNEGIRDYLWAARASEEETDGGNSSWARPPPDGLSRPSRPGDPNREQQVRTCTGQPPGTSHAPG